MYTPEQKRQFILDIGYLLKFKTDLTPTIYSQKRPELNYKTVQEFRISIFYDSNMRTKKRRESIARDLPDHLLKIFLFSYVNKLAPRFVVESVLYKDTIYMVDDETDKILGMATLDNLYNERCEFAYIDSFITDLDRRVFKNLIFAIEKMVKCKYHKKYIVLCTLKKPYSYYKSVGYEIITKNTLPNDTHCEFSNLQANRPLQVRQFNASKDTRITGYSTKNDPCLLMIKTLPPAKSRCPTIDPFPK